MAGSSRTPGSARDKVEDAAGAVGQTAREAADKARDAASSLGDRAREVASNLGERARDAASGAAERADDALSAVGSGMSSLAGTLRGSAPHEGMLGTAAEAVAGRLEAGGRYLQQHGLGDMGEDLNALVRQYPVASLLAVFGMGFLLGRALGR